MVESSDHARLGPSSAHRWMSCPASARLVDLIKAEGEEGFSEYAAEGTAAHTVAELTASYLFGQITEPQYEAGKAAWLGTYSEKYDWEEMAGHALTYVETLAPFVNAPKASLRLEVRGQSGIEGVWGTADAAITDPYTLTVVDYKYGEGVRVSAIDNPQLKLYALGAWESDLIGTATRVRLVVVQPRLDHVSEWTLPLADLLDWRENVARPAAEACDDPDAPFGPSEEACRFCPARGQCKAQMQWIAQRDFGEESVDLMTPEDYAEALALLPSIRAWATVVEERALEMVYSKGEEIPGWKTVMSGGRRQITDEKAAIEKLVAAGYDRSKVERVPEPTIQTLGELDKVVKVGKKKVLAYVLGDLLKMTEGRPSLVPESDGRPAVTALDSAANDFAEIDD